MPKIQETASQYLKSAMENLRKLQELKLLEDYDSFAEGYDVPQGEANLATFLAGQYRRNDPALHVEYLRSKASSFKAPDDMSEDDARLHFQANMDGVVDELNEFFASRKMLSATYEMLKNRLTGEERDAMLLKFERSAYDVVSALFSIAITAEYTDKGKILDILCDMIANPPKVVRRANEYDFKKFIVQNIKAIGEVYCDDRKVVLSVVEKLRDVSLYDRTLVDTFIGIKTEFVNSGDSRRAMSRVVQTVSDNLNIVDVCEYAINMLFEVSTRDTFGDAMFYMNYIDSLGFVSPDMVYDKLSLTILTFQSQWLKLYDPYNSPEKQTYKDEYINKGVPQFKLALMAMYSFVKSHKDMHDEYSTTDYVSSFRNRLNALPTYIPFMDGKCFEILKVLDGKKPTEILDLVVERFNASENDFQRTCILSTIFELVPVYCKEGTIDKFMDGIDKLEDLSMISDSFVMDLAKVIVIYYPMLKENDEQVAKIFHNIIPKLAIKGVNRSKIFETISDYIIRNPENWEYDSLNTRFWSSLIDIFISPDVENDEMMEKHIINATFVMMGTAPSAKLFMSQVKPLINGCAKKEQYNALPRIIDCAYVDKRAERIFLDRANNVDGLYVCVDEILGMLSLETFFMRKETWSAPPCTTLSELLEKANTLTKDNGDNARPDLEKYIYGKLQEYRGVVMSANAQGKLVVPQDHMDVFEAWMMGCLPTAYNFENNNSPLYDGEPQEELLDEDLQEGQPKKKKYHNSILNIDDDDLNDND